MDREMQIGQIKALIEQAHDRKAWVAAGLSNVANAGADIQEMEHVCTGYADACRDILAALNGDMYLLRCSASGRLDTPHSQAVPTGRQEDSNR